MGITARARTDTLGRFLVAGVDFTDMADLRARNYDPIRCPATSYPSGPVNRARLENLINGIPYTRRKGLNTRYNFVGEFARREGLSLDAVCEYWAVGSMTIIRSGVFEYRARKGKVHRVRIPD